MTLVDFFDNCRYWGGDRNPILQRIYYYPLINRMVNTIANVVLPIYFKLTASNPKYSLKRNNNNQNVIVSLTSFPVRLPRLWLVIESILRQTVKPDRIILYLTRSQVESEDYLPKSLHKLKKRGLEIVLCPDNIRSHTKYFYAISENPNDIIITVDDDIFYRSNLVESLLREHGKYPNAIIANWAKEILPSTTKYAEWPDVHESKLSNNLLLLGVGGVLYPGNCLYKDTFNVDLICELSLTADDVWLSCMASLSQTPIYYSGYKSNYLSVSIKNNETLISGNYVRNQIQVDNLNEYYNQTIGIKPFVKTI